MPDRAGMVSDLCIRTGSGLYAAVTGHDAKALISDCQLSCACKIHPAGGILRSLPRHLLAFVSATLMDRFLTINRAFYPLMVITQTIPTIAIAPVLVLWMGFGMAPKIALVVITTFFPIAVGLLDGYKSVDQDAVNLMRAMGATKFQIFRHLKFPSALNQFFSGLKISASYAVVGAVVAEWLGGFNGLGVYMTRVKKAYAFDKMFAVIIFIVIISLLLMLAVNIIRNLSMPWIRTEKEGKEV